MAPITRTDEIVTGLVELRPIFHFDQPVIFIHSQYIFLTSSVCLCSALANEFCIRSATSFSRCSRTAGSTGWRNWAKTFCDQLLCGNVRLSRHLHRRRAVTSLPLTEFKQFVWRCSGTRQSSRSSKLVDQSNAVLKFQTPASVKLRFAVVLFSPPSSKLQLTISPLLIVSISQYKAVA